jgi:hypothetical protein
MSNSKAILSEAITEAKGVISAIYHFNAPPSAGPPSGVHCQLTPLVGTVIQVFSPQDERFKRPLEVWMCREHKIRTEVCIPSERHWPQNLVVTIDSGPIAYEDMPVAVTVHHLDVHYHRKGRNR